jgi:hypothetical protein
MRLVIKNSIQLCLRTLVFSIVLRHSNYNNMIISIEGTFFGDTLYKDRTRLWFFFVFSSWIINEFLTDWLKLYFMRVAYIIVNIRFRYLTFAMEPRFCDVGL